MEEATVTVVLVTYNRAAVLPRTIESLLSQTYGDFRLIVSDDCSQDETSDVVSVYVDRDERVRYRRNEVNLGIAGNLNATLADVSSPLVAITHDGDIYEPELLQEWIDALAGCPRAAFVFNHYREINAAGETVTTHVADVPACMAGHFLIEQRFFRQRFGSPVWGTVMVRRAALVAEGGFSERFGPWTDVDMWLRLAESHDVAYVPKPLIVLPSREALPHRFAIGESQERRTIHRIYLEARTRHFRGRPVRLAAELIRHHGFIVANAVWRFALSLRRQLVRPAAQRAP